MIKTEITPKEHPLIFSTDMVQAILDGRKTQTRRIITKYNSRCDTLLTGDGQRWHSFDFNDVVVDGKFGNEWYLKVAVPQDGTRHRIFSKVEVGNLLWAREMWTQNGLGYYRYKADWSLGDGKFTGKSVPVKFRNKWKPSIHMPKEAARIWLKVTKIRAERLQDISEEDAIAEGANRAHLDDLGSTWLTHKRGFQVLWNSIHGEESWEQNPLVWVKEFEKIDKP